MNESSADEPSIHGRYSDLPGRDVPAEDSPVPAGPATVPLHARPWQGPDHLVLRAPDWGMYACLWIALIVPVLVGLILAAANARRHGRVGCVALAAGTPLVLPAALMAWFYCRQFILPRVTFDRKAGLLTLGWKGLRGRRPLPSVVGVQVMETRKQFGDPEHNIPAVTMYQLNLILDDPAERRLNVMTCDLLTARSNARLVADFLGVPVLDSAGAPAGAAAAAAAGTAEPMPIEFWQVQSPVVTEPGPDILLIRPRRLAILSGLRRMGLAGVVALLALAAAQGAVGGWFFVAVLGAPLCFTLLLVETLTLTLGRRASFDRARGVLTLGWLANRVPRLGLGLRSGGRGRSGLTLVWLGRQTPRPLASVKAVEVVASRSYYQLNLLPDDPRQPRLNLIFSTDAADAALVRRAAERVASFLGVPLLAASRQTPRAARSGGGEAVNLLEELNRSPLAAGSASVHGPARIVPKGEDILVLRPRLRFAWVRLTLALLMIGPALYVAWLAWRGQAGLVDAAAGLTIVLLGEFSVLKPLLLYRDHFDLQTGLLTLGWFGRKGTYPLAKVRAVQLVPGGLVVKAPGLFGRGGERVSYQLNLVVADADEDRLNLTNDSGLAWTRQAGRQVADFLGVPVIDQIADGD